MLGMAPALSPPALHIPLLSDDNLFIAYNSRRWSSLIGPEGPWSSRRPPMGPTTLNHPLELTGFGLQTLLATIWLRILKCQRNRSSTTGSRNELWTSWPSRQSELTDSDTPSSISACLPVVFKTYATALKTGNGNSLILWHYLCMTLTTNLSVIENAAGRNGPEAAKRAVDSLKIWAKTPASRRACLHAIQALLAISEHRQCDGVMLHTEMALFHAALVLGLYLLTAPDFKLTVDTPCYDLFDPVDWVEVGNLGLTFTSSPPSPPRDASPATDSAGAADSASAARSFIQHGAPVCFRGGEYQSSYGAARRSFMNFAAQLEEIGKWNVQEYCKVLYIISDTLFASDGMIATGD